MAFIVPGSGKLSESRENFWSVFLFGAKKKGVKEIEKENIDGRERKRNRKKLSEQQ